MTIIQKINDFFKKSIIKDLSHQKNRLRIFGQNYIILITLLVLFSLIFLISLNLLKKDNLVNAKNFKNTTTSSEFLNLSNFFLSKINSPYVEKRYLIENNDSIERILKKFKIKTEDIKTISYKLKQKKTF